MWFTTKFARKINRINDSCLTTELTFTDVKSFECNTCHLKYKTAKTLREHIKFVHSGTLFSCEECPFTTYYSHSMKRHSLTSRLHWVSYGNWRYRIMLNFNCNSTRHAFNDASLCASFLGSLSATEQWTLLNTIVAELPQRRHWYLYQVSRKLFLRINLRWPLLPV